MHWLSRPGVALCRSPFSVHRELSWSADALWTDTVRELVVNCTDHLAAHLRATIDYMQDMRPSVAAMAAALIASGEPDAHVVSVIMSHTSDQAVATLVGKLCSCNRLAEVLLGSGVYRLAKRCRRADVSRMNKALELAVTNMPMVPATELSRMLADRKWRLAVALVLRAHHKHSGATFRQCRLTDYSALLEFFGVARRNDGPNVHCAVWKIDECILPPETVASPRRLSSAIWPGKPGVPVGSASARATDPTSVSGLHSPFVHYLTFRAVLDLLVNQDQRWMAFAKWARTLYAVSFEYEHNSLQAARFDAMTYRLPAAPGTVNTPFEGNMHLSGAYKHHSANWFSACDMAGCAADSLAGIKAVQAKSYSALSMGWAGGAGGNRLVVMLSIDLANLSPNEAPLSDSVAPPEAAVPHPLAQSMVEYQAELVDLEAAAVESHLRWITDITDAGLQRMAFTAVAGLKSHGAAALHDALEAKIEGADTAAITARLAVAQVKISRKEVSSTGTGALWNGEWPASVVKQAHPSAPTSCYETWTPTAHAQMSGELRSSPMGSPCGTGLN